MENIFFHIRTLLGCLLESSNAVLLELIVTKKRYRSAFKGGKSDIKRQFPPKREKILYKILYSEVYS